MIEHDTPVFTPSQHPHIGPVVRAISKFSEHWQSIISVAWTNINIKLVQLDNSAMKQQHEIDSSITTPIIGDTSDSSNVNNKLSKYNCLGMYFIYHNIIRVISVYILVYKFPCDKG